MFNDSVLGWSLLFNDSAYYYSMIVLWGWLLMFNDSVMGGLILLLIILWGLLLFKDSVMGRTGNCCSNYSVLMLWVTIIQIIVF